MRKGRACKPGLNEFFDNLTRSMTGRELGYLVEIDSPVTASVLMAFEFAAFDLSL